MGFDIRYLVTKSFPKVKKIFPRNSSHKPFIYILKVEKSTSNVYSDSFWYTLDRTPHHKLGKVWVTKSLYKLVC